MQMEGVVFTRWCQEGGTRGVVVTRCSLGQLMVSSSDVMYNLLTRILHYIHAFVPRMTEVPLETNVTCAATYKRKRGQYWYFRGDTIYVPKDSPDIHNLELSPRASILCYNLPFISYRPPMLVTSVSLFLSLTFALLLLLNVPQSDLAHHSTDSAQHPRHPRHLPHPHHHQ